MFAYTGQVANSGKKVKSSIEAESIKEARVKLRKQNIYVLEIKQDTKSAAGATQAGWKEKLTRKPPKIEDVALATKQLSILVRSAVDISEALKSVSEQVDNEELRSIYVKIRESVSEGKSLSEAHGEFPQVFSSIYINMLGAAEKAGALPLVLRRLSDFMIYQIEIKRKLIGALTYPAMMIAVSIGITIYLFVSVLPKITKAFGTLRVTLPWYTVLMNRISAFMQEYWILSLALVAVAITAFVSWSRTPKGSYKVDKFLYTGPIVGPLIQRIAVSRFSKTLSTVLSAGVRIVEALQLTRKVIGNKYLEEAVDEAIVKVQDGEKLAMAMERSGRMPVMVIHMLRTGEKTGKLEEMLVNIAEVYDEEVDHQVGQTTKALQPIILIFMAGIIMLMAMSVLGPMMSAMSGIK